MNVPPTDAAVFLQTMLARRAASAAAAPGTPASTSAPAPGSAAAKPAAPPAVAVSAPTQADAATSRAPSLPEKGRFVNIVV